MSAKTIAPIAIACALFGSVVIAENPTANTVSFQGETYLADGARMTLYTFAKDAKNTSNCYDACAANWPPLQAIDGSDLPQGYKVIDRKDGTQQVAYKGKPLYLWVKDAKPGDMTGDGVKGVWFIARP